uniref:Caspase 20, apoptosis-related cysteine peptidase n=1 Tax=Sinocyclocheilus rhinocerous TaxID=307959 RepID=A0A673H4T7_9TELE
MLNFSKSVPIQRNKLIYTLDGLRVSTFSANFHFGVKYSFKLFTFKHLEKVFRWLGFEVVAHRNKTAAEMKNLLKDVGKTVDGDCFVCCILSHGLKEGVYGTDGAVISVDEIREPFNGNNCQRLVGKPKMFFIQACRGKRNQDHVLVQADSSEDGESEMEVDGDDFDITIPADTDFLIARSATDGHLSYRRPEEGSWFIQSLCRNLEQHCPL